MPQIQYSFKKNDEYYTPEYAVIPIIKYLKPHSTIWCPFDKEESNYVKVFRENKFNVIYGHIEEGQDFFKVDVPKCDYIISNPPYSKRTEIIERLFNIDKPFAMLINMQGIFDSKKRFELFSTHKTEMLWISPRVSYVNADGSKPSGVPFQSGYICSNVLPKQLVFESISTIKLYSINGGIKW